MIVQAKYGGGVPQFGLLGDWCALEPFCPGSSDKCLANPGWTNGDATSAFYFVKDVEVLVQMARVTGNQPDVQAYSAVLEHAKTSYHSQFFNHTSQNYGVSQTGNALGAPSTLRMQLQPGIFPFPVLGFGGKFTMPNAGTMRYRRDLPSTTRI